MRCFVLSINLVNAEALAHWGLSGQKQKDKICFDSDLALSHETLSVVTAQK